MTAVLHSHTHELRALHAQAGHGYFSRDAQTGAYETFPGGKPATAFLFKLIAQLQFSGTVPMIDVQAYAEWLSS